ncbi:MAG: hypothetical protein DMF70_05090 [Acidobacteria bacterium]|nr:MAG: hypothetical protein DMF70_05090 [Acidobacteriota bacterium]
MKVAPGILNSVLSALPSWAVVFTVKLPLMMSGIGVPRMRIWFVNALRSMADTAFARCVLEPALLRLAVIFLDPERFFLLTMVFSFLNVLVKSYRKSSLEFS